MEGQLRFDSARYGAALDIVFTGSVEHLRDQEWQNDKCEQPNANPFQRAESLALSVCD